LGNTSAPPPKTAAASLSVRRGYSLEMGRAYATREVGLSPPRQHAVNSSSSSCQLPVRGFAI